MDVGGSEECGLVLLEVHLLGAGYEPDVVEVAGVAEVEAALLVGERGDVGTGDDGETDEDEDGCSCDAGDFRPGEVMMIAERFRPDDVPASRCQI